MCQLIYKLVDMPCHGHLTSHREKINKTLYLVTIKISRSLSPISRLDWFFCRVIT